MTTNGPYRPSSDRAQGRFPDTTDQAAFPNPIDTDDLGELSRKMLSRLSQTIEGDIIPRLMLAFDSPQTAAREPRFAAGFEPDIEGFVQLLLNHDASVATTYMSTLRAEGIPLSVLYLDLLSPAARRLGVMWEDDECSFTDVTIGVCRMHQVLLEFSRCFDAKASGDAVGRNALIVPTPGEQHTFGLFMVMEFLRRAGWTCWSGSPPSKDECLALAREQSFDVIGISISSDRFVDATRDLIGTLRRGSRNGNTVILAGGRAVVDNPGLTAEIGADAMAKDGEDAVRQINRLYRKATGKSAT